LPYAHNALEPHISERTLRIHHGKHHAKYVATANEIIKGTELENASLDRIIRSAFGKNQGLFNNAGQVFNHDFYWKSMKPNGGGKPSGKLEEMINDDFGSYEKFRNEFVKAANTAFGSGWAWLVWTNNGLKVSSCFFLLILLFPFFRHSGPGLSFSTSFLVFLVFVAFRFLSLSIRCFSLLLV
jgi:Fe-Mn family superoxide dismutase